MTKRARQTRLLAALRRIVDREGGVLLSRVVDGRTPLWLRCAQGHVWSATPVAIRRDGAWCPTCDASEGESPADRLPGRGTLTRAERLVEVQAIARGRDGRFLRRRAASRSVASAERVARGR
jgi:hypothetical protein